MDHTYFLLCKVLYVKRTYEQRLVVSHADMHIDDLAITTLFGKGSLPFNPLPDSHLCQQSIVSKQEPNGRLWIRGGPSFRREPSAREPVLIRVLFGQTEGEAGGGS